MVLILTLRVSQVRCIWRVVLPLLDMGYQVDVRILNAVHYAVPQLRKVCCSVSTMGHGACFGPGMTLWDC